MGIQGLLPLLKSIMNPIHIKELEGSIVAIDTYSWLHKGALSCSTELCKGQPTSKYLPPLLLVFCCLFEFINLLTSRILRVFQYFSYFSRFCIFKGRTSCFLTTNLGFIIYLQFCCLRDLENVFELSKNKIKAEEIRRLLCL